MRRILSGIAALGMVVFPGFATAHPQRDAFAEAISEYVRGDYVSARSEFEELAARGHVRSAFWLGLIYDNGDGVLEDDRKAAAWYRTAADGGDADAQTNLANFYYSGEGVPQSYSEAVRWWRLAAQQGDALAQNNLASAYSQGLGVAENDLEATRLFKLAANQGLPLAQAALASRYHTGNGVTKNLPEAARWYEAAAQQDDAAAQYNLGLLYYYGEGVPLDYVQAYRWLNLAARKPVGDAVKARDGLQARMTPYQIAEAQRLSAEWKPVIMYSGKAKELREAPAPGSPSEFSTGSGFYVTTDGALITNAHVVDSCTQLSLSSGAFINVLAIDAASDLALLKVKQDPIRKPLTLRQGRGVRLADSIIVAGYPLTGLLSSGLNVTTGTVSALAGPDDDRRLIQITAPVQPGNSGGPLLDTSGNVVGVVVSKLDAVAVASITGDIPQNVNFAVSLGTLQAFLDANGIDYQTRPATSTRSNADVADIARVATVQIECRK